jgi:DNA-binding NarL/FixJ family response regulator
VRGYSAPGVKILFRGKILMNNRPNSIRIVIADEKLVFRRRWRRFLESDRGFQILGEASDGCSAVKLTRQLKPDILLVDLGLPRRSELQALNGLGSSSFPVRTVVTVRAIEKAQVIEAFGLGANGILLKTSAAREFLKSIRSVMAGDYWLGSQSLVFLVEALREFLSQGNGATSPKGYRLTPRELGIMAKIAQGHSNKEVGQQFCISERTVKHHLTSIFNKVGVSSRLELALFAVNHRLMGE